jgi:hypothetical protein
MIDVVDRSPTHFRGRRGLVRTAGRLLERYRSEKTLAGEEIERMARIQERVDLAEELPEVMAVLSTQVIFPDQSQVESHLESLKASSQTYQAALKEIHARKLKTAEATTAPTGWYVKDSSVTGDEVRALTFVQDLGSGNGTDSGLIGVVVDGVDEKGRPVKQETWEIVEKPSGADVDPSSIRTIAVFRDGSLVTTDIGALNIFSRLINCVKGTCASVCLGSLTACAGVFPVYLKCVAVSCGGCALKCGACATCNCSFWCRWAVGCCKG